MFEFFLKLALYPCPFFIWATIWDGGHQDYSPQQAIWEGGVQEQGKPSGQLQIPLRESSQTVSLLRSAGIFNDEIIIINNMITSNITMSMINGLLWEYSKIDNLPCTAGIFIITMITIINQILSTSSSFFIRLESWLQDGSTARCGTMQATWQWSLSSWQTPSSRLDTFIRWSPIAIHHFPWTTLSPGLNSPKPSLHLGLLGLCHGGISLLTGSQK